MAGEVLGVSVEHADQGGGPEMVEGRWTYPDGRTAALEVTTELATEARTPRRGEQIFLSGSQNLDTRVQRLLARLAEPWAGPSIAKLNRTGADERHLYLWGRGTDDDILFSPLVDSLPLNRSPCPWG